MLIAVVTFLKHFKHYLLGGHFKIRTDHTPLVWLRGFKESEGLYARWISIIEIYDYELQYRPGIKHRNADSLSRIPKCKCPNPHCNDCAPKQAISCSPINKMESDGRQSSVSKEAGTMKSEVIPVAKSPASSRRVGSGFDDEMPVRETMHDHFICSSLIRPVFFEPDHNTEEGASNWLPSWSTEQLIQIQKNDPSINIILESKTKLDGKPLCSDIDDTDPVKKSLWFPWENLEVRNGLLYRKWTDPKGTTIFQLIAADQIRKLIFENLHANQTAGHFDRDGTVENIRRRFYWPTMNSDIARWIKECDKCKQAKPVTELFLRFGCPQQIHTDQGR